MARSLDRDIRWRRYNPLMLAKRMAPATVVATFLGLGRTTVHNMIDDGRLRAERVGQYWYIPVESLRLWFAGNAVLQAALDDMELALRKGVDELATEPAKPRRV